MKNYLSIKANIHIGRQKGKQTERKVDRQIDRPTDRQRQIDR